MVCSDADGTTLTADIDADGYLDEVRDPGRSGDATVVFSKATTASEVSVGEGRTRWQKAWSALFPDMETRGAFGDFDDDGYVDVALFHSQEDEGDHNRDNVTVHEVRHGPLARDLSGGRTTDIRMRGGGFVYAARATDENGDGRAELHVFQSSGDGAVQQYTGRYEGEGVILSPAEGGFYGRSDVDELELGWQYFGICAYPAR
ncbi:hypothetical protein QMA61_29605 [Streptomyces coelicoflavus]|uniref:hypothetical protein n=1 Tax=Streptomyces coelicoflavus TaxID=285562 RepID=UPI0024ADA424|nr:hypothetical protein [Streptomyces coelicoflavus]MDI6520337.1 hypothetical protein [Streptomyces coelicoflavus]